MYFEVQKLKSDGCSERKIAKHLKINRQTVRKLMKMDMSEAHVYFEQKVKRTSEFEKYYEFIVAIFQKFPLVSMSNVYHQLKLQYPDLQSGDKAFRNYVIKNKLRIDKEDQVHRWFEPVIDYKPGEKIQVDPGEKMVEFQINSEIRHYKVYFISFVLCWSRKMYASFSTRPYNTEMFINAHLEAFQYFGGLAREYVYDQTKLVVIKEEFRETILNERFKKFALSAGFGLHICEGYDPESKGMVEKSVDYIKDGFLEGRIFNGFEDVRRKFSEWLEKVANPRIHRTTKQRPDDMFLEEKKFLKQLNLFCLDIEHRKADKTGLISYQGKKYSVPFEYQSKNVKINISENILYIYNDKCSKCIAEWNLNKCTEIINKNKKHYEGIKKPLNEVYANTLADFNSNQVNRAEELILKVKECNPKYPREQLTGLSKLLFKYGANIWNECINDILSMPCVSCMRIDHLFKGKLRNMELEKISQEKNNEASHVEENQFRDPEYYNFFKK